MKVLLKRTAQVMNGSVVQIGASNIVEPRTTGGVLGVASACREITIQNTPDDPVEALLVCQVAMHGDCQATLSGGASSAGCEIYATADGKITASTVGETVGVLVPKALSETADYVDGDLVNVVLK
jgi:hypothetical protein